MDAGRLRRFTIGLLAALVLAPPPARAELIPSKAEDTADSRRADLARVTDVLARDEVSRALAAHGLSPGDVEARVRRLSREDLRRLAANLDQIQAAGNVPNYIWVLLGIFLAVSILAIIF